MTLRRWQENLKEILLPDCDDDRKVRFYVDEVGNVGKTWFMRYMQALVPHRVSILTVESYRDMAYLLDHNKDIVFFNVGRKQMEKFNEVMVIVEHLKDRMVMSTKYYSVLKVWRKNVHVVVMGNEEPDRTLLSRDRYHITHIRVPA